MTFMAGGERLFTEHLQGIVCTGSGADAGWTDDRPLEPRLALFFLFLFSFSRSMGHFCFGGGVTVYEMQQWFRAGRDDDI